MALNGGELENRVRCAFTAAITTVYDVHFSEVAALQNEIQRQQKINEVQQKRIEELECHLHRMRRVLKSSKAKIRQQLCAHRKLKQLVEEHNIPIPHEEKQGTPSVLSEDSTSSDKGGTSQLSSEQSLVDEDAGVSQEPCNVSHREHRAHSDRSFAEASINFSSATIDLNTSSSEETENENEDDVIVLEEDAKNSKLTDPELQGHKDKLGSQARETSNTMEGVQQPYHLNSSSTALLEVVAEDEKTVQRTRKLPDIKGQLRLHVSERPSKIKYKDVYKHDGDTTRAKVDDLNVSSPSSAPAQTKQIADHQDSNSPSPSLLCKPISPWKSAPQVQDITSCVVQGGPCVSECEIVTEIPLSDSQLSLDVSQTIPPSLEVPPAPLRKRNHAEAFPDHSDQEQPLPNPCGSPLLEPKHPGGCHVSAEHTDTQQNVTIPSGILPKTPGIKAMSSMALGDKAFFAGVHIDRKTHPADDARTDDNDATVLLVSTPTHTHTFLQDVEDNTRESKPSESNVTRLHSVQTSPESNPPRSHGILYQNPDEEYSEQTCHAKELAAKAGLPLYKCDAVIRNRADRNKLDGKECSECRAWYSGDDGLHRNRRDHLKQTCRHKHLYHRQDSDPKMWNISFPNTEEM